MVNPPLRAVWCTVSFDKINFNGRRAVVKFAQNYIRTCIKTTQMSTHICIVLHIMAQQDPKIFNTVDVLEQWGANVATPRLYNHTYGFTAVEQYIVLEAVTGTNVD